MVLVLDDKHRREIAELEEKYFFERENIVVSTDADQRINILSNCEYRLNQARLKLKQDHYRHQHRQSLSINMSYNTSHSPIRPHIITFI